MAIIKSFTDLQQSKVLAKILPLESADYCWGIDKETLCYNNSPYPCAWKDYTAKEYYMPCWSLSALLSVLPKVINNETLFIETSPALWHIGYRNIYTARADNPVDACVAMIERLHELKML